MILGAAEMPKVLFLDAELGLGGSEQLLLTLMQGLRDRGATTSLLYRDDGPLLNAFQKVASRCWQASALAPLAVRHPRAFWSSLRALRRAATLTEADVVVAANPAYFSLLGVFRKLGGCPVLVHLGWPLRQRSPLYRQALRWIDAGIAPAPAIGEEWVKLGWPQKSLHTVPNGINSARFRPCSDRLALRHALGVEPEGFLVVFVGRMVREKGIFTLLRAWGCLAPGRAKLRLLGPAETWAVAELHRLAAELGLNPDSWSYAGTTQEPETWLAAADLAVVPSENNEPFGLAAVEAMACNALTIVSDSGALPSLLPPGHSGKCLFPEGDFAALADRLRYWINAPLAETTREARRGASHASKQFGGDHMVAAYERVLQSIISPEKSRVPDHEPSHP